MLVQWFLSIFIFHALQVTAEPVVDCPENETEATVPDCNFYCGKNSEDKWRMGYYKNGTKCKFSEDKIGLCILLVGNEGCYDPEGQVVKDFLGATSKASIPTTKPNQEKGEKKKKKKSKGSKDGKKPNKQKSPKSPKKQKDGKKAKPKKDKKVTTPTKTSPETEW
uniref:Basic tail protein n=1 Tax=Amblyomma maculatum TaxID=34609 RepID=G3MKT3_AMBMU